jgi:hypothetical protein
VTDLASVTFKPSTLVRVSQRMLDDRRVTESAPRGAPGPAAPARVARAVAETVDAFREYAQDLLQSRELDLRTAVRYHAPDSAAGARRAVEAVRIEDQAAVEDACRRLEHDLAPAYAAVDAERVKAVLDREHAALLDRDHRAPARVLEAAERDLAAWAHVRRPMR